MLGYEAFFAPVVHGDFYFSDFTALLAPKECHWFEFLTQVLYFLSLLTLQLWSFKMIYCCEGVWCDCLKIKLHCITAILHCCTNLISSWFGEDRAFWGMSSCPNANLGSRMKATFIGLLDPEGFSQVLSSDFLVLDFLCYSTREPSPFTIMEPFTHHPAWNKEDQTRGDQRQNYRK